MTDSMRLYLENYYTAGHKEQIRLDRFYRFWFYQGLSRALIMDQRECEYHAIVCSE